MTRLFALAALVMLLAWASGARAHEVGLSRGEYTASATSLDVVLALSHKDALALLPGVDADGDGTLAPVELDAALARSPEHLAGLAAVKRDGAACSSSVRALGRDQDGIALELVAAHCDGATFTVDVAPLLAALPSGHRHAALIHAPDGSTQDALLFSGASTLVVASPGAPAPPPPSRAAVAGRYAYQGIIHILEGTDHVVFLLGLLLAGARLRHVLGMVTAFTVSHSVTLGLAVLGVVAPPPRIIEPLIALSVAYVGVENFVVKDAAKRWRVTGVFGLVHGFGFAGALGEVGVPTDHVPLALGMFNVGVEVGQLCIIGVAYPLFHFLRKVKWIEKRGVQVASAAVVAAGLYWFVTRVLPAS